VEEFEYSGDWWLPEDPDNEISGTLTYSSQSGAHLALIGSFKDPKNFRTMGLFARHPIILGITTTGKEVTLYRCSESEINRTMGGIVVSKYRAVITIVGCHFSRVEDITFRSLALSYTHLAQSERRWHQGQSTRRLSPRMRPKTIR